MGSYTDWKKRKFYYNKFIRVGFCICMVGLVLINASQLWAEEPYYKGKVLILFNNFPPGGSSDVWTRLQSRHISRFILGQPTVIVQNMGGANGIIGYQWLTKVAKPDGLTVGCMGGSLAEEEATSGFPPGTLSLREANVIASVADADVCIGRKAVFPQGYKSLLSPTKRPFVIAQQKRDDTYVREASIMNLLGLKKGPDYTQVYGYQGANDLYLALGRGEADVSTSKVSGYRQTPLQEVKAGNWVPLLQCGVFSATGELIRHAGVDYIPTIAEVTRELTGKDPSGPYYEYLKWKIFGKAVDFLVIVPPRTPKEILSLLTEAWRRMAKDPQFLSDQEKVFGSKGENMLFGEDARSRALSVINKPAIVDKVFEELINK